MANIEDLIQRARTIRIETKSKKNTAVRIGGLLLDIVSALDEAQVLKKAQYGGIVATSADVVSDYAAKDYSGPYFYLVGSSFSSLVVYQYAGTGDPVPSFGGAAYNFSDYSEALSRIDALSPKINGVTMGKTSATTGAYYNCGNVTGTYSGATANMNGFSYYPVITLQKGQTISIAVLGGDGGRAYCITDATTDEIIAKAAKNQDLRESPFTYTATKAVKVYITDKSPYDGVIVVGGTIDAAISSVQQEAAALRHDVDGVREDVSTLQQGVEAADEKIETIEDELGSETELTETGSISPYVIDTDGSLLPRESGNYTVHFFEVAEGDMLRIHLKRTNAGGATRLSMSFYATVDGTSYTHVPSDEVTNAMRWPYNGTRELDYTITVPEGANRVGIFGGAADGFVALIYVADVDDTPLKQLQRNSSKILDAASEVEANPNNALNERLTAVEEAVEGGGGGGSFSFIPRISNPRVDIRHTEELRVLSIGNSFTVDTFEYFPDFITAANLDVSDICIYKMVRSSGSFNTFWKSWNNNDTYNGSTGCFYSLSKVAGGLSQPINGSNNYTKMHSVFEDVKWDIIMFHQVSQYAADYEDWEGTTSGGRFIEFLRILRTYQPQAMLGYVWTQTSFNQSEGGDTAAEFAKIAKGVKWLQNNCGIDFVVPIGAAIENLRASSLNVSPVAYGFSRDGHHLGFGMGRYVSAATYFHTLMGARYGVSVLGSSCVHAVTSAELADASATYPNDCVDVDANNKELAQKCAVLACCNMYSIVAPDDIVI